MLARSTMTTASAPGGIVAPVMMRLASPGPTVTCGACPAAMVSTTRSSHGASATSAERTANPSMAVLANGGMSSDETISLAVTRPNASATGTRTGVRAGHLSRTNSRTVSSGSTASNVPATLISQRATRPQPIAQYAQTR